MPPSANRPTWWAGGFAAFICLGFAAYTQHAWEDYLITFRASLNLATGHDLVYQPGERVHSFTSPLGTWLPARLALGGGVEVETKALWLFRVASASGVGYVVFLVFREFRKNNLIHAAVEIGLGLWMFDPKIVDFSINGMESGLVVVIMILTWRALIHGASLWPTALGFAGLSWTRPDGFVFASVLALAWLWLETGANLVGKRESRRQVARAAGSAMVIYFPWFLFAWIYYGSPIPHTISAKHYARSMGQVATALGLYPLNLLFGQVALHDIFAPAYYYFGGWPSGARWLAHLLGTGAALAWLFPGLKAAGRIASGALFLGGFYLRYIPGSPWYFPGWQVLACISSTYLLNALANHKLCLGQHKTSINSRLRMEALSAVAAQNILFVSVA